MQELKDKCIDPFTYFGFNRLFGKESNKELLPSFLNELLRKNKNEAEKYRYDVMLSDINIHKIFYDKLIFIHLEVPKFTKEVDDLKTNFEKWMYVLKNLKRLDSIPDRLREHIFERIFASAEIAKLTPAEYRDYINS